VSSRARRTAFDVTPLAETVCHGLCPCAGDVHHALHSAALRSRACHPWCDPERPRSRLRCTQTGGPDNLFVRVAQRQEDVWDHCRPHRLPRVAAPPRLTSNRGYPFFSAPSRSRLRYAHVVHAGAGASNVIVSPVCGCRIVTEAACRHIGGASTGNVCTAPSSASGP